ncbi:NmrA family NAD(P)-binding protein [Streptomyces himalayensis]|uniref:NmrA family NAD(P)-binding protein n=1 Tax=Streptomyces himalayensis TaxID=2820085 RepID=UPI0028683750|nr:NmrA family NAD(P)-binding protein [Streptomyces himalayensis]
MPVHGAGADSRPARDLPERDVEALPGERLAGVASTSAEGPGFSGKRRIEHYLRERIPLVTVLRPVRFMTNFLTLSGIGVDGIADGVHRHIFPPYEPVQVIALEDIAEFAALAFDQPDRFAGRTLEAGRR